MHDSICTLDLGSSKFCMTYFKNHKSHTLSVRSQGLHRGRVIDFESALTSLCHLILQMEDLVEGECTNVILGLDFSTVSEYIQSQRFSINNRPINPALLSRIYKQFHHPQSLYQHPRWFRVDNMNETLRPNGYMCSELEIEMVSYIADLKAIKSAMDLCNRAGLRVIDLQLDLFACFHAMNQDLLRDNHLIVDIGGSSTKVLCLKEGSPYAGFVVHAGSASITKDLMHAYNISFEQAEHIKLHYGAGNHFDAFSLRDDVSIRPVDLQKIILPRIDEIIDFIDKGAYLRNFGLSTQSNFVLGGGTLINGLRARLSEKLGIPFEQAIAYASNEFQSNSSLMNIGMYKNYLSRNPNKSAPESKLKAYRQSLVEWVKQMEFL